VDFQKCAVQHKEHAVNSVNALVRKQRPMGAPTRGRAKIVSEICGKLKKRVTAIVSIARSSKGETQRVDCGTTSCYARVPMVVMGMSSMVTSRPPPSLRAIDPVVVALEVGGAPFMWRPGVAFPHVSLPELAQ
jgi:hypothetical protein